MHVVKVALLPCIWLWPRRVEGGASGLHPRGTVPLPLDRNSHQQSGHPKPALVPAATIIADNQSMECGLSPLTVWPQKSLVNPNASLLGTTPQV